MISAVYQGDAHFLAKASGGITQTVTLGCHHNIRRLSGRPFNIRRGHELHG